MTTTVALLVDARVTRGGERVLEADLGALAAAEHEVAVEVVDHARVVAGGALDDEPRRALGVVGAAERRGGVQAGGVGRRSRAACAAAPRRAPAAEVAPRAARDPQQEQVEHGEEAELERDGYGLEGVHPSSKTISVEPSSMRSPGAQRAARRGSRGR